MSFCLSVGAVELLHAEFPDGGSLLHRGRLEAALARPNASAFGADAFPSLIEKASALLQGIASAHAFDNANKRTAWSSCTTYLALHGLTVVGVTQTEAGQFVLDVTERRIKLEDAAEWLNQHTTNRPWP